MCGPAGPSRPLWWPLLCCGRICIPPLSPCPGPHSQRPVWRPWRARRTSGWTVPLAEQQGRTDGRGCSTSEAVGATLPAVQDGVSFSRPRVFTERPTGPSAAAGARIPAPRVTATPHSCASFSDSKGQCFSPPETSPLAGDGTACGRAVPAALAPGGHFQMVPGSHGFLAGMSAPYWGGRWAFQTL